MLFSRKKLVLKFYRRLLGMMEKIEGQNQDGTAEIDVDFSTRKAVRKIMTHVLPVQEVIQFGNVTLS